jgi:ribosomal subunit interface protein
MSIQVTGKHIDTGEAYQAYVAEKINSVLNKYIGPEISGHVRVEKERGRFHTACSIRLLTGLLLEAHGEGDDAYASADAAVERMEKRVRRYKRRLKGHHNGAPHSSWAAQSAAADYVVQIDDEEAATADGAGPVIIAETARALREMPVSEAVMQLDLTEDHFLLFRNAASGEVNVVYRRPDGNVGWIDPGPATTPGAPGAKA